MIQRIKNRALRTALAWLVLPPLVAVTLPMWVVIGLLSLWQGGPAGFRRFLTELPLKQAADLLTGRG